MPAQIKTKANTRRPVPKSLQSQDEELQNKFLKGEIGGQEAVEQVAKGGLEKPLIKTPGWTEAIAAFFNDITQVHLWERIGKIVLGIIVLVFGIYFFSKAVGRG